MWRRVLVLLSVVGLAGAGAPAGVRAETVAYGAFRLVKAAPAVTAAPEISLSEGYGLVAGARYQVASRAEYYSFVSGPRGAARVSVRWPGVEVAAVVHQDTRLPFTAVDGGIEFSVPVTAATTNALQPTLQVWSYPSPSPASGVHWRIEHNDRDRVAGVWNTVPWPAAATRTFIHLLVACAAILDDSGLAERARRRGHFFSLMGFETNNTLHADNPPHWHLSYYPGPNYSAPRAHVPHFWMDNTGRTFYNGMDVQGEGRTRYYAGDPAPIEDARGNLVVTLTIRADGGLDIDPPDGSRYSITAPGGRFTERAEVLRDGVPWRWFAGTDDVKDGLMTFRAGELSGPAHKATTVYFYDELTGVIRGGSGR